MNIEYKEFIGIYRDVYPTGYCNHMIQEFEKLVKLGAGRNRQEEEHHSPKHIKDDLHISFNIKPIKGQMSFFENISVSDVFFEGLQYCYDHYNNNFSILQDYNLKAIDMKMQRSCPGKGYHVWHSEKYINEPFRVLVYSLYLNTLEPEEAGETEFLYQKLRIRPEENMMVIWPAAFTHAHRGNVVHGKNNKYIITGWFNLH